MFTELANCVLSQERRLGKYCWEAKCGSDSGAKVKVANTTARGRQTKPQEQSMMSLSPKECLYFMTSLGLYVDIVTFRSSFHIKTYWEIKQSFISSFTIKV